MSEVPLYSQVDTLDSRRESVDFGRDEERRGPGKVDIRLPGSGNANSHGARLVY